MGFFQDGESGQSPVVIGIYPGLKAAAGGDKGFQDPRTPEQIANAPKPPEGQIQEEVGKPTTAPLARGVFEGTALQKAWIALDVPQCGYCQSGQLMAATALLKRKPKPTDADIDSAMANICRCGTYQRVRDGIYIASGQKKLIDVLRDYANPGTQQKA